MVTPNLDFNVMKFILIRQKSKENKTSCRRRVFPDNSTGIDNTSQTKRKFKKKLTRRHWTVKRSCPASCHFGISNTVDKICKRQVPSVALRLLTVDNTRAARRRSCSVYNSCGLTPSRTEGRVDICRYFVFETRISSHGSVRGSRI